MRTIKQIDTCPGDNDHFQVTLALCDDGTVWELAWRLDKDRNLDREGWEQLPLIPQGSKNDIS